MTEHREPHDPTNSHQIMCEHFRKGVLQLVLDADKITVYRELSAREALSAEINGILVGILQVMEAARGAGETGSSLDVIMRVLPEIHAFATTQWEKHQS